MPTKSLELNARGLGNVLRDRQLAVPAYQRPYAWTTDNVLDFRNDLRESLDRGDDVYFLGAVVLAADDEDRDTVIDGQQRLATGSLLFAAFRDAYLARGEGERAEVVTDRYLRFSDLRLGGEQPRLQLNDQDHSFFEEAVIKRRGIDPELPSHRRLGEAATLLTQLVEEDLAASSAWEERVAEWVDFVDKHAQVIVVEVPTQADAFLIFETLNDRGAPLTIADLLKTYLMSRSGDGFAEVNSSWSSAMEILGAYEETPEVADFLRHYWSSLHGATRERDLYRSIRDTLTRGSDVVAFAGSLPSEAEAYAALLDPAHPYWAEQPGSAVECARILGDLGLTQNRPLLMAVLARFSKPELARALGALVGWAVRGLVVGGIGGGRTERAFATAAVAIRSGRVSTVEELYDNLRPTIPSDDEFRQSFETATMPRRKIAEYLMKAIETGYHQGVDSPLVSADVDAQAFLHQVMPAHADPSGWPGFAPEDIGRWVVKIGNYALLDRGRRPRAPHWTDIRTVLSEQPFGTSESVARFESWNPEAIRTRQRDLAQVAVELWPRGPRGE